MTHSVAVSETNTESPENLVQWVTDKLVAGGHPNPEAWKQNLKPGIDGLPDPNYQIFEINRAMRLAIAGTAGKDLLTTEESMDVRYSLIDKCAVDNWKMAFEQGALPCILRLQLPIVA